MTDRTLIISATNVLARGFYAVPTDRRSSRGPVNALFALARGVLRAMAFKAPARAVAIIDSGAPFPAWPPLLSEQLPELVPLLEDLGLKVVTGSDELRLVAAYAKAAVEAGDDVVIAGTDKRFAQLVSEKVWWYDVNKDARYTVDMVVKRFGVGPEKVAEWLALVGNEDDGLPGIAGIGAKGAAGLLEAHGSVANALLALDTLGGRTGKALQAAVDTLPAELARARLEATLPLPVPLAELTWTPPAPAIFNARCKELGFLELLASDGDGALRVELRRSEAEVRAMLASIGHAPAAVQPVTEDPTPVRGALVGLALCVKASEAWFVPVGEALDAALVAWLQDPSAPKLGHDTAGLDVALRRRGVHLAGVVGDTAIASHLAQPSNWAPHDLPIIAKQLLGKALPTDDEVRGVGRDRKQWAALDLERLANDAGLKASVIFELWQAMAPTVDQQLQAEYFALDDTLVRMELAGFGVDASELTRAEEAFNPIEADLEREATRLAGHAFNLGSSKQLGEVLFAELKLPIVSHTKTGWSTANEALERIEHAHPIVPVVLRWRMLRRLIDGWLTALRDDIEADGRVHSRFHGARSFSGRIVNMNPDLGRVPGRTPEMARVRRAFAAREGHALMSVDYNQLGLHVLAHLTRDPALVEPLKARADVHLQTAAAVLEKPPSAVTPEERQLGKVINFATFAGQGASSLALQLGIDAAEAKQLIARFDRTYAKVREFQDEQLRLAHERGYIQTIAGRHWPIGGLESLDPMMRSYAERLARRATHEGSVADVGRKGLLDADRALRKAGLAAVAVVQVLDEVVFEVPQAQLPEAARIAADAMRAAFTLEAPLRVGVEVGPNWADLEPYNFE